MRFTKMHGCGNDYIYVCTVTEMVPEEIRPELAVRLSDRHKGIGSDGIIFINPADNADFEMEMYNADGSRSQMCGNGIRCVGKYVYDHRLTDKTDVEILTGAGVKRLSLEVDINKNEVVEATVDMGAPILEAAKIPVDIDGVKGDDRVVSVPVDINDRGYNITCVSMGNPHCVTFMDEDVNSFKIEEIGPAIEHSVIFPEKVNAEFINVVDRGHLRMRVWERGSGETLACGTGACASAVAGVLNGVSDTEVDIKLLGGELHIRCDENLGPVYMTGPAVTVFEGEVDI